MLMARPLRTIDWAEVEKLIECGCSGIQIAGKFKIDADTFYTRFMNEYGVRFADYSAIGVEGGKADIKLMLHQKALNANAPGNVNALIFLGKTVLGMKEAVEQINLANNQVNIDLTHRNMQLENELAQLKNENNTLKSSQNVNGNE